MSSGPSKGAQATAGGGVSPFQQAFAQYSFGENELGNAAAFSKGMPMSTNLTQADVGAQAGEVLQLAEMSDADAAAQAAFVNANTNQKAGNIGQIGQLAGNLGTNAGGGGAT